VAMAVPLSGATAQQREILLLLAPAPEDPNDLQYSLELVREARMRLENRLRHRIGVVKTDDVCQLLRDSGFDCDVIVDETGAARMAQAMGVDAYMLGKLWFRNQAPLARFRMVDIGRSGLSGWVTIRGTAGDPPRSFAQTIVDTLLTQTRAAELARECNNRRDQGDFERALKEAEKVFEMYPNHPSAAICAAVVREAMGQPPDSQIPEYERAIRGDSLLDRAYQRLGQRYLAIGDSLNALGAFRSQMYLTPEDRTRWYGVINQYIAIGEYGEAETIVNEWLERHPNDMEFLTLKTSACFRGKLWECAVASLEKQYELNDEFREDPQFYKDIMAAAMAADLPDAVMRWSGVAVENVPDDLDLWKARASTLNDAEMTDEAVVAYERILALDPENVGSAMFLAQHILEGVSIDTLVPLDTAALGLAREYLDMASYLGQDKADTAVMMNLAVSYLQVGSDLVQTRLDIALGLEWLERALENDVMHRLTDRANFFIGLGLVFTIYDFDPQINAYVERFADLTAADKQAACLLVAQEAAMIGRGKQAMIEGAAVHQPTADQMLVQYSNFEARVPQLQEAFECN
jgi:tetratricopeptide (TPR) repeat protein